MYLILPVVAAASYSCKQNAAATPPDTLQPAAGGSMPAINVATALRAIQSSHALLQDGDLITRSDDDFESLTLQNFSNSDRTFSHSGIAFKEADGIVVYHSMTGAENPAGLVRRDPYDSFVNPLKKTGFGIFRYSLSAGEREKFHDIIRKNHADSIPFDVLFNIHSSDSLYCSEMIYKALKKATSNRITLPTSRLYNFRPKIMGYKRNHVLLKNFEYISIDNLYLNPYCREILRVKY